MKAALFRTVVWGAGMLALTACSGTMDRLEQVGKPPPFKTFDSPSAQPGYKPISWPMPEPETEPKQYANSLWQQGSRTFFRDQRASRVGDILKILVNLKDKGKLENKTDRTRESSEDTSITALLGMENLLFKPLPGSADPGNLLGLKGGSSTKGDGQIERKEELDTQFAATVVQVLPNGNLVIDGRQEIRINNEIREIAVQGVVRPQDIGSNNTIDYSQIAEARITYGGRGHLSEIQGPRWGHEVMEVLSPF